MHVLHWTELWRPVIGGAEILTEQLAEGLGSKGHRGTVITCHGKIDLPDFERRGCVDVHRFPFQHALAARDGAAIADLRRRLAALLETLAPDLVHLHTLQPSLFFHAALPGRRRPTVITLHEPLPPIPASASVALRTIQRADAVVALSRAGLASLLESLPEVAPRASTIVYGLVTPASAARETASEPGLVVCAGRLVDDKGFDLALRAVAVASRHVAQVRLLIAGDGPCRRRLENLAAELGIGSRVEFLGWRQPEEVEVLLARARVALVPSRWPEPFGLVALQAGQQGRAVVVAAVGALPEIVVDGVTGLVVPRNDADAMGAALTRLLGDADLATSFGRAGKDRAARCYSIASMVDAYDALYERLLRGRGEER